MLENAILLAVQNKTAAIAAGFITSGLGINIILRIVNKIPLDKINDILEATAKTASSVGRMKFHKPLYEPCETFFQKALTGAVEAINRGLDADDNEEEVKPETPEVKSIVQGDSLEKPV